MSRLPKSLTLGFLTGILGVVINLVPFGLDLEENIGLDLLFKLRGAKEAPSDVLIVTIDKASADKLNLPPDPVKWPRTLHALLTENLAKRDAAVIAFDILFEEPHSPKHDNLFAKAISNARNVVLCESIKKETIALTYERGAYSGGLHIEKLAPPILPLGQSAVALAPFPLPKVPVKVSQYWTFKAGAGDTPTLPIVVFQLFTLEVYDEFIRMLKKISPSLGDKLPRDKDTIVTTKGVVNLIRDVRDIFAKEPLIAEKMLQELKNSRILSANVRTNQLLKSLIRMYQGDDSRYLNFYGLPGTVPTVSYYQVLQSQERPAFNQSQIDFNGKAVFIGLSERLRPEQKDGFHTVFSQRSGIDLSGVEIAATAFANLLEDMPVQPLDFGANLAIIFLWGVAMGIFCYLFPPIISAISVIGVSVLYLITVQYQFKYAGSWYPLVTPLFFQGPFAFFGTVLWKYFDTNKERQNLRMAFGYYLPNRAVDQIAKDIAYIKTSSETVYGTLLSTDARQYTKLAEIFEDDPKKLHNIMSKYYEVLFNPIKQHGGRVSDIIGDSVLALWATANPDAALRNKACYAALDIASDVDHLNKYFLKLFLTKQVPTRIELPTRIGLHYGRIELGSVGAVDHYEYRPMGDAVNTASRMEGLNRHLGTQILVSEEVLYRLDGFLTRNLGTFVLAGKSKAVVVYELICRIEESTQGQRNLSAIFNQALSVYRRQSWEEAIKLFCESAKIFGEDGPSTYYLEECQKYREYPPGENWEPVICLNKK